MAHHRLGQQLWAVGLVSFSLGLGGWSIGGWGIGHFGFGGKTRSTILLSGVNYRASLEKTRLKQKKFIPTFLGKIIFALFGIETPS
jgi:hypothetical protein